MKKIFALVIMICMFALPALAAESGNCGKTSNAGGAASVKWTLDDFGTLTISGTGDMYNYWVGDDSPWKGDDSVKAVVVESGVTSIGTFSFWNCGSLTSVTIADTVTKIGKQAFASASSLNTVTFAGESQLQTIDSGAFSECFVLTDITLPSGVTNILYDAFTHCNALEEINIAEGSTTYKSQDGVVYSADGKTLLIYPKGKSDASFVVPEGVTEIGVAAFIYNEHLTNITIPKSVKTIGASAFWDCDNLQNVTFTGNSGLTAIGESAFGACEALTTVNVPCDWDDSLYIFGEGVTINIFHTKEAVYVPTEDGTQHIATRPCCGAADAPEDHSGGNATCMAQAACEDCGQTYGYHAYGELIAAQPEVHTRTELKASVAAHYICGVCDEYFTEDKTETTLEALSGDTPAHSYGDWINTVENKHWKECVCGLKAEEGSHIYDGHDDTDCNVCGYVRTISDANPFEITKQPTDQYVPEGQRAEFSVEANGDGLTYQWYISRNDDMGWEELDGAIGPVYTTSVVDIECDGFKYGCMITDRYGNVFRSDVAVLHVSEAAVLPPTGDASAPMLWLSMSILSMACILLVRKKAHNQ